jgi:AraC family transcriptional regulator, transcriptional activator FtrA
LVIGTSLDAILRSVRAKEVLVGRHRVAIVVLPGTFVLDLAVAVQAFGRRPSVFAKIRDEPEPPYEVVVCGDVSATQTSLGFSLGELAPYSAIADADTVLVPGTEQALALDPLPDGLFPALRAAYDRGARMVSLCAGAFVLGSAGILDGHRVTTHWMMAEEFRAAFPRVQLLEHALYVDDGQVLTSGGMLAATDLCLYLIAQDHGQSYANDVSRLLVSPPHRVGGQSQYAKAFRPPLTGSLAPVLAWLEENLSEPFGVAEVAARAHMSQRTLVRRFRAETGEGLAEWVARHRVERARALLEDTDLSVTQVAHDAGFGSVEALRRHFLARVGTSPRAYRDTFRAQPAVRAIG